MSILHSSCMILALAFLGCSSSDDEPAPDSPADPASLAREELAIGPPGPQYSATGELERRDDWPRWVFLGASRNLSYSEEPPPADFFANVFMEPGAFAHFEQTGEFREGTLLVAAGYLATAEAAPAAGGQYAGEQVVFEMSVKDSSLDADVPWRYYSFADGAGTATANPREACFDCHTEHAATDHVFTQFYPVLRELLAARQP